MKRRPSPRATADAYEKGVGFKVAHKRCDQCLFSDAKIVSDERRGELLKDCTNQGTYFICHKATARGDAVVCRGFFDLGSNQACRMAEQLSIVVHVDASTGGAQVKEQLCLLPPDPPAPLDRGLLAYWCEPGIDPRAAYRYTHWIGMRHAGQPEPGRLGEGTLIYDATPNRWIELSEWARWCPSLWPKRTTGWCMSTSIEVATGSCSPRL